MRRNFSPRFVIFMVMWGSGRPLNFCRSKQGVGFLRGFIMYSVRIRVVVRWIIRIRRMSSWRLVFMLLFLDSGVLIGSEVEG